MGIIRFQCDLCLDEVTGYTRQDLINEGWEWKSDKGSKRVVALCDECVKNMQPFWGLKASQPEAA